MPEFGPVSTALNDDARFKHVEDLRSFRWSAPPSRHDHPWRDGLEGLLILTSSYAGMNRAAILAAASSSMAGMAWE